MNAAPQRVTGGSIQDTKGGKKVKVKRKGSGSRAFITSHIVSFFIIIIDVDHHKNGVFSAAVNGGAEDSVMGSGLP